HLVAAVGGGPLALGQERGDPAAVQGDGLGPRPAPPRRVRRPARRAVLARPRQRPPARLAPAGRVQQDQRPVRGRVVVPLEAGRGAGPGRWPGTVPWARRCGRRRPPPASRRTARAGPAGGRRGPARPGSAATTRTRRGDAGGGSWRRGRPP